MRPVAFVEEYDPRLQERVRSRYAPEAGALAALGFRELCCYSELLGNYSLLLYLPVVLLMRAHGEVLSRRPTLQVGASYLLHYHSKPGTIALPLGLGVKFYTGFSDGTVVVTASFASMAVPRPGSPVLKEGEKRPIADTWQRHQRRVEEAAMTRTVPAGASFASFVVMAQQEERSVTARGSRPSAPEAR